MAVMFVLVVSLSVGMIELGFETDEEMVARCGTAGEKYEPDFPLAEIAVELRREETTRSGKCLMIVAATG